MGNRKPIAPDEEPTRNSRVAKSSTNREVGISVTDMIVEYQGKMYKILSRGIRDPKGRVKGHRVEIRPAGSSTKIWVGTFSTREKAKRAYDVALHITGKDAYYYKYPQNYFPQKKSPLKAHYVKEMARKYAEKTEKFPVNPSCLIMNHVSLLPEASPNLPCLPEDSLVTLHAAESPFEISQCGGIDELLTLSDESQGSWQTFEMDQHAIQPAAGYKYLDPDDLWFPNHDCSFDENFISQLLETPPLIASVSTRSSEESDFEKITKSLFESDDNDQKSTAIIDQGLNESQPQLNLFNPIEDGDCYLPVYSIEDQKPMQTMCDTNVEQLWKTESVAISSSVDNLYTLFQW